MKQTGLDRFCSFIGSQCYLVFNKRLNSISKIPQLFKIRTFNMKVLNVQQNLDAQQISDIIWANVKSSFNFPAAIVLLTVLASFFRSDGDDSAKWLVTDSLGHSNKCNPKPHYLKLPQQ